MNKVGFAVAVLLLAVIGDTSMAQGIASLEKGTKLVDEVFTWLTGLVIAGAAANFLYVIVMAIMDRKSWGDVLMALIYGLIAGAAAGAIKWAVAEFAGG